MKGTEETPLLTEVSNTRKLLPAAPVCVQRSRELVYPEPEESKFWEQNRAVLWYVWRGVKADCRKNLTWKNASECNLNSSIKHVCKRLTRGKLHFQFSEIIFWFHLAFIFLLLFLIEVWFVIYIFLHYSNPEQALDCFMSWNCSEITAWKPWMCISSKDIF